MKYLSPKFNIQLRCYKPHTSMYLVQFYFFGLQFSVRINKPDTWKTFGMELSFIKWKGYKYES